MTQHSRPYASATVALLVLALAGSASAAGSAIPTAALDTSAIRIENFGRVSPALYRGAQPRDHDYLDLAKLGIKTVINLTSDDADPTERGLAEQAGLRYVQLPMTTHRAPTDTQLTEFLRLVNDPASQPVYVHCVGGRHRTGVMAAVYRMTADRWTADQAFKEMKQYDFGPDFLHAEFKRFVYGYRAPQPSTTLAVTTPALNGLPTP